LKNIVLALILSIPFAAFANVTVYKHCDFGGFRATLPVGSYDLKDLEDRGILNDDISALKVADGYEVIVYEHHHFSGRSLNFKGNDSCLVDNDFNDRISSIKVRKVSNANAASVYQHCDYRGYRIQLAEGSYNLNQLERMGIKNDDLSSLKVANGYEMIAYEHHNFSGRSVNFKGNDSCLVDNDFNDRISSIKVRKARPARPVPTRQAPNASAASVYQHCDYRGYHVQLSEGNYDLNQLERMGIKNDDLSSIKVNDGYEVIAYQHHHFSGNHLRLKYNTSCLVDNNFNDTISSIKVRRTYTD
jgi:putative hemolysin